MDIKLIGSTNSMENIEEMRKFSQSCGRQCYTSKDFEDLIDELYNEEFLEGLVKKGHHSVFEHINLTFRIKRAPKMLAMLLNNEKQYATSEKSARYTVMKDMDITQRSLYDKWLDTFKILIDETYPKITDKEKRNDSIKKLAQENARYITSVFTPTNMVYTINLRQLNFIVNEFDAYAEENKDSKDRLKQMLIPSLEEFAEKTKAYHINGLKNMTDRHLSLFRFEEIEEHFGFSYSTTYLLSFAALAQGHRHRTIGYQMETPKLGAEYGFFIPKIIRNMPQFKEIWLADLHDVAKSDFPQAQLIKVNEYGALPDFRSKLILRLCGHAQHEIMENTRETAEKYAKHEKRVEGWTKAKCEQGFECNDRCIWGGKQALERLI